MDETPLERSDVGALYTEEEPSNPLLAFYHENPFVAVAVAAGVGYVAAGGLWTPFTRRMVRMGMRALLVPVAATQLKNLTRPIAQEL